MLLAVFDPFTYLCHLMPYDILWHPVVLRQLVSSCDILTSCGKFLLSSYATWCLALSDLLWQLMSSDNCYFVSSYMSYDHLVLYVTPGTLCDTWHFMCYVTCDNYCLIHLTPKILWYMIAHYTCNVGSFDWCLITNIDVTAFSL